MAGSMLLIVLLCVFTKEFGYALASEKCASGWEFYNSKCYFLGQRTVSYTGAKAACGARDSKLASLANRDENYSLKRMMSAKNVINAWIGLYFIQRDCTITDCLRKGYKWEDGTEYTYPAWHNWKVREPREEDRCAYLSYKEGWIGGCGTRTTSIHAYICEKEAISATKTTGAPTTTTEKHLMSGPKIHITAVIAVSSVFGACLLAGGITILCICRKYKCTPRQNAKAEEIVVNPNSPSAAEAHLDTAPAYEGATDEYLQPTPTPACASGTGSASQRDESVYESIHDPEKYENLGLNIM